MKQILLDEPEISSINYLSIFFFKCFIRLLLLLLLRLQNLKSTLTIQLNTFKSCNCNVLSILLKQVDLFL